MLPKLSSRGLGSIIATKLMMSTFELFKLLNRYHNVRAVSKLITINLNWGIGWIFKPSSHKNWLEKLLQVSQYSNSNTTSLKLRHSCLQYNIHIWIWMYSYHRCKRYISVYICDYIVQQFVQKLIIEFWRKKKSLWRTLSSYFQEASWFRVFFL